VPTAHTAPFSLKSSGDVPLDQRRWWPGAAAAAAAWVAVVHVSLWWLDRRPLPRVLWGDENRYLASATKLLAGDPGWWPEPLWPPLYPQFVSGVMWFGRGSLAVLVLVQGVLLAATAALLGDLTRRVTGSRAAGLAVAVLTLGYPPLAAFSHYLWPEILHLFLFSTLLWLLVARWRQAFWCAMAGVVLGLALLSKSLLMPFVPVFLLAAVWGQARKEAVPRVALMLVLTVATVTPTVLANARRTGTPMIANSAAFNLWVGLNDVGRESFRNDVVWPAYQQWEASADTYAQRDQILRERIRDLIGERGWLAALKDQFSKQYFRLFHAGCYLTDQLPGGGAQRQSGAGYIGVGPRLGRVVGSVSIAPYLLLLVAAPVGLAVGGCRRNRWVRTLVIFIAYNLLLFLWFHVKTRYRIQMMPAALVGVGCLVAWVEAGFRPRPSKLRIVGVVVVVALLFWFAIS